MKEEHTEFLKLISHIYLLHGKYEKALIFLLALKRIFPTDAQVLLSRSYAYLKLKAFQASIEEATASKEQGNTTQKNFADLLIAKSYFGLGNIEKAKEFMQLFITGQKPQTTAPSK